MTGLFVCGRKRNISIFLIAKSCFEESKDIRLNSKVFYMIKIPNKKELQQTAFNHF